MALNVKKLALGILVVWVAGWRAPAIFGAATPKNGVSDASKAGATVVRFDPLRRSTEAEIKIFADLAKRDEELREKEAAFKKEALLLKAAESSLDEKIKRFESLKAELDEFFKRLTEREDKQIADLVKTYEAMNPKRAAAIFDEIDLPLATQLIKRMNKRKAALVMAAMDSSRAKDVTQGLARESQNISLLK